MTDLLYSKSIGDVYCEVLSEIDEAPWYDYLGHFCDYTVPEPGDYLYHLDSGKLMGSDGNWRISTGEFCSPPQRCWQSNTYEFALIPKNGQDCLRHFAQDGARLRGLSKGDWWYINLHGRLYHDGKLLGEDHFCGIESDCSPEYLRIEVRNLLRDLLYTTKKKAVRFLSYSTTRGHYRNESRG